MSIAGAERSLWSSLEREAATIGVVDAVGPNRIDIAILPEAPHGTGLRDGALLRFPRINSYVVLPTERGSLLALVYWLGIDEDRGRLVAEPDHIGLPKPRRRLQALPLGVLHRRALGGNEAFDLHLERGVLLFPTVGDPVRLPTRAEAAAAVPRVDDDALTVRLGRAPLAGGVEVVVDPNRLLGRHLAILGNTGSGKSCTVTTVLRRCAEAAGESTRSFRAIVLDLNGEYATAFDDLEAHVPVRRFSLEPNDETGERQLRVPAWLWNFREWLSFSRASARSQSPQLRQALDLLRTSDVRGLPPGVVALVQAREIVRRYQLAAVADDNQALLSVLDNVRQSSAVLAGQLDPGPAAAVAQVRDALDACLASRKNPPGSEYPWKYGVVPLSQDECSSLLEVLSTAIDDVGVPDPSETAGSQPSGRPTPFDPASLIELLPLMAADSGPEAVKWLLPLIDRLRIAFAGQRFRALADWHPDDDLRGWLDDLIPDGERSQISVLDLSLVPSDMLQLTAAVLTRILLEALERRRRLEPGSQVPVVLVAEEAHALMPKRVASRDDETISVDRLCRDAFERVAREGRKFGLSLVVSSQRPSEVSETVLSQCNTFLVHRIVNDHDQALVRRLVPDSLGPLTEELPALPSQVGLLLGWAVRVPVLVKMDDLARHHQPHSSDPDFVGAWTGGGSMLDWAAVTERWGDAHRRTSTLAETPHRPDDHDAATRDNPGTTSSGDDDVPF